MDVTSRLMRKRNIFAIAFLVCIGVAIYTFTHQGPKTAADMVAWLPRTGATLAYMDVAAMRKAGLLDVFAGPKTVQDPEYQSFIQATGFDYRRDLDAFAGAFTGSSGFFVVRGRFDWNKLRAYTQGQKGECKGEVCSVPATQPGRWVSYYRIRSNVMALASSPNRWAALDIASHPAVDRVSESSDRPVWIMVPPAILAESQNLPAGAKSFASPLASAERVVFSIGPSGNELKLFMEVASPTDAGAADTMTRMQAATDLLRRMLARENQQPSESDLSGLLTGGTFRREGRSVYGEWPLYRKLIQTIAAGGQG